MSAPTTVRAIGRALPPDLLVRVAGGDRDLAGLTPDAYHLAVGETAREAANRAWSYLTGVWAGYRAALARLPDGDPAVGLARDKWLLLLLGQLGYGRPARAPAGGLAVAGRAFPVSHEWQHVPVHLLGPGVDLDRRTKGVPGAAERAPHAMLQELLNRDGARLWGLLSNGRQLRLLRDTTSLSGQSYVEFDLEAMFDGEVFADFVLLYLLAHQSRVEVLGDGGPADCWLERWRAESVRSGTRALGLLRVGVRAAVEELGTGFLRGPGGADLDRRLTAGDLRLDDYHRAVLRLVYRLLFLFVAEDRGALLDPAADPVARARYADYFSTARLRRLALRRRGTGHTDLWQGLAVVLDALGRDDGRPELGLPGLGGLFDPGELDALLPAAGLPNDALLAAVRHLHVVTPPGQPPRTVDYRNLGAEELGSVYESLLELTPRHDAADRRFALVALAGNERKTTGSYYTPTALIDLVLDEALTPVLDDAEKRGHHNGDVAGELLRVTVCDPACGSGHFLVAAARRIADRLAVARTGDVDPTPADQQAALYDVVSRCIYGIDVNPMAADLAKVSLWLESAQAGRPLTVLDAHVKVGNALLGTTPALLAAGLPDAAFAPIEGDDRAWTAALRKRNADERDAPHDDLFDTAGVQLSNADLRSGIEAALPAVPRTLADAHVAQARLRKLVGSPDAARHRAAADAWCAAFVQHKVAGGPDVTTDVVRAVDAGAADGATLDAVAELAERYRFFHWHLEFPEVFEVPDRGAGTPTGWLGGFSCVVGNPPWERVKLQEKEFFASRDEAIATARNAAARKARIEDLATTNPVLSQEWLDARRRSEGETHLLRSSGRYPLTGRGDVNTYSVFAETMRAVVAPDGRAGVITPTGLATDATTAPFFADTLGARRLAAFYDFENEAKIFAGVHNQFRFAVTCATGGDPVDRVRFAFYTRYVDDVEHRRFDLAPEEVLLLNPNTGTLPVFRTRADAEITLGVYRRHLVLALGDSSGLWQLGFARLFDMANDSDLFHGADELPPGAVFDGWAWRVSDRQWLPLYEAKLLGHYDHRYATYDGATQAQLNKGTLPRLSPAQHDDPAVEPLARYWVAADDVDEAVGERWDRDWLFGWRDIARASDARTMVPCVLPRTAVGNKFPLALPKRPQHVPLLQAVWSSLVFDYIARQKLASTGMTYFIVKQLACPPPEHFDAAPPWAREPLRDWVLPRVLELTYTSSRIAGYARTVLGLADDADPGPPFRWVPERRELLRAELDAAMLHVFGLTRPEAEHVLDSFFVVRKYEERDHGEFRTKRLVLDRYDAMAAAATTGEPYRTALDPPPGAGPRHG